MDTIYYVIFAVGAMVLVGCLYIFSWRKKPADTGAEETKKGEQTEEGKETESSTPPQEVLTYNILTRRFYPETIPGVTVDKIRIEHGNLGRKRLYEGRWLYALVKDEDDNYSPIIVPVSMENPPSRLHRALTHPQVAIVYNVEPAKNLLQKYGHILLFTAACAFLMFMLVAQ